MKTQKKNSMKKYFGLFSSISILPVFIFTWQLSNFLEHENNYWNNWSFFLVFYLVFFISFGGFLGINNDRLTIYRVTWFLNKRNTFELSEINKVCIRNGGQVKGVSVVITIFDIDGKYIGGLICQMFNFELRRLKKKLEELDIEVEIDEIWGRKI